jgi:hypothetical protein
VASGEVPAGAVSGSEGSKTKLGDRGLQELAESILERDGGLEPLEDPEVSDGVMALLVMLPADSDGLLEEVAWFGTQRKLLMLALSPGVMGSSVPRISRLKGPTLDSVVMIICQENISQIAENFDGCGVEDILVITVGAFTLK